MQPYAVFRPGTDMHFTLAALTPAGCIKIMQTCTLEHSLSMREARNATSSYVNHQAKRRQDALTKQRQARQLRINASRLLQRAPKADQDEEDVTDGVEDVPMQPAEHSKASAARQVDEEENPRVFYAGQFMHPEWMTDVPEDLGSSWLVTAKPEGPRCLAVTARGRTFLRGRSGSLLAVVYTGFPNGGPSSYGTSSDTCVVDAVWHGADSTLYVLDVLVWRGYALHDCAAEFRTFWLQSKLSEDPDLAALMAAAHRPGRQGAAAAAAAPEAADVADTMAMEPTAGVHDQEDQLQESVAAQPADRAMMVQEGSSMGEAGSPGPQGFSGDQQQKHRRRRAVPRIGVGQPGQVVWLRCCVLPWQLATSAGIEAAYSGHVPFTRDGLCFMHKDALYVSGSNSPLSLQWKDAACSPYLIDTDADGKPLEQQVVNLEYRMDATVATADDPPIVLGRMPDAWIQAMGPKLRPGKLLQFALEPGSIAYTPDGRPCGAGLKYLKPGNQRRGRADNFSKILFQHAARTNPIAYQLLIATVTRSQLKASA